MRRHTKNIILFVILLIWLAILPISVSAQELNDVLSDEVWCTLEESFYWNPSTALEKSNTEIQVKDEYGVIDTDANIALTKLIPTFSIPTDSKSEMLKICDEINEGTPLLQLLENNNEYYTITKDSSGNDNGFALLSPSSDGNILNVEAFGEIDDQCRQDLQLTASIREKLQNTNLDIPNTVARHCTINNFSVGVLFSDGKNEYYMPTVETFQSLTFLQLGDLYSPTELTDIINDNIATIFPTNEIDESGNPYLGGGEYPEVQQNIVRPNYTLVIFAALFLIASCTCFIRVLKMRQKSNR